MEEKYIVSAWYNMVSSLKWTYCKPLKTGSKLKILLEAEAYFYE